MKSSSLTSKSMIKFTYRSLLGLNMDAQLVNIAYGMSLTGSWLKNKQI